MLQVLPNITPRQRFTLLSNFNMTKFFPILLASVLVASCGGSRKAAKHITLPEVSISSADDEYRATADMTWDITHTDVALSFDLESKTADGQARLTMHPWFYASDKIVLDAKSMSIKKVNNGNEPMKFNYSNDSLTIYLSRKYHRTETVTLEIAYTAMPYAKATSGGKAITDEKGLYFINADGSIPYKPVQIWTQGETEANSHWAPTFDKPNERFTTRIALTVADSFTTLSNGEMVSSVKNNDGTRTDTWEMDKPIQPYVMMYAIGKFKVVEDEQWNGKHVNYYVEPEFEEHAKAMFRNTPEMIGFFSDVTGVPYPWNKYSQVVVRDYVSGAMENTSATLFGEFINQTTREINDKDYEDVVSHELFHQWFGDYVTAESWSHLTLNESFATYGEQLWRKYKYGKASQLELAHFDKLRYLGQAKTNDVALTRFHYKEKDDMFDRVSYQKGATILHYMHGLMGDSAFYRAMNVYLTKNALSPAETDNWRMAVEEVTGKDWNWFFDQWYMRGGHPVVDVKYNFDEADKKVTITLEQKQEGLYMLPLHIRVLSGNDTFGDIITLNSKKTSVTYPYPNTSKPAVIVDADHWLPGKLTEHKTTEEWTTTFKEAPVYDYTTKTRALLQTSEKLGNRDAQELYRSALNDPLEKVREYALNQLTAITAGSVQNALKSDVHALAVKDASNHVRAAAFRTLGKWKVSTAEADMYNALNDESYKVAAAALGGISALNKDTAYTLARRILATQPGGELDEEVWNIIGTNAAPADSNLFADKKYRGNGGEKLGLAYSAAAYMKNTPDNAAFDVALNSVVYMVQSESITQYRISIASYLFDVAYFFKDEVAGTTTKSSLAKANYRLNAILKAVNELEKSETNEDNKTTYETYRKDLLGKK